MLFLSNAMPLGVLSQRNQVKPMPKRLELFFNSVDDSTIIDSTGRHTVTYTSGIHIQDNVCIFDGGISDYITVNDNPIDVTWNGDFYVVGIFTPTAINGYRTLWDTHESALYNSPNRLGIYTDPLGAINVYTAGVNIAGTDDGVVHVGVSVEIGFFRKDNQCYFIVNGELISDFELTTQFNHVSRKMFIGGSSLGQLTFEGSLDNFMVFTAD